MKHFLRYNQFAPEQVQFSLGERNGKVQIAMTYAPAGGEVALVTAPAVTSWPRVSGDGNFGTMWGPSDVTKAKYTLDLNDAPINEKPNADFEDFKAKLEAIDERLLDFVTDNQLKILGRKNLSREEVKMLQIRSVRPKFDKHSGTLNGYTVSLSTAKFAWDGMGGKYARQITICDHQGHTVPHGQVTPGDVVAATIYAQQVYTGVGGDKFGIQWSFQDVSVVCQRVHLAQKAEVSAFVDVDWAFAKPYTDQVSEIVNYDAQFCAA
jgi:hypothetical protein